MVTTTDAEYVNEVRLVGRVSGPPRERELPSGDRLVGVRVVVPRRETRRRDRPRASVDTIECVAWLSRPRAALRSLRPDDLVSVQGELRRRFWRGESGSVSRVEVEVAAARRIRRPGRQAR